MDKADFQDTIPNDLLVHQAGMQPKTLADHSRFAEPISSDSPYSGYSRRWGDASLDIQRTAVQILLGEAANTEMPNDLTALMLATARVESGFNPDAAAGSTSAGGLGQFIDSTAKAYGVGGLERFSLADGARALAQFTLDNYRRALALCSDMPRSCVLEHTYALHHDGPSLKHGGLEIARTQVMPWAQRYQSWIESSQTAEQ